MTVPPTPNSATRISPHQEAYLLLSRLIDRVGLSKRSFLERLADLGFAFSDDDFRNWGRLGRTFPRDWAALRAMIYVVTCDAVRMKLLPLPALLACLTNQLQFLTTGAHDLPARQQTLRNAIAWSYDLLAEAEQILVAELAVFVGGSSLEAVEAVCLKDDHRREDLLDLLMSLVDQSLLQRQELNDGTVRFGMLEMIRGYAFENLTRPKCYQQVMQDLDRLEDYDPLDPEHGLYLGVEREVLVSGAGSASRQWAWIYHLNPRRRSSFREADLVADGDWLRHCAQEH